MAVTWGATTVLGNSATSTTAPSTGGFSFGATTPSTPTTTSTSLFGGTSNTTNAGSTPAPTTTTSAFSFSSPNPSTGTTSLFGTPKSPSTSTGISLFGTPSTTTATNAFSQQQQQQQFQLQATPAQAALQAQMHAQQLQEATRIESSLSNLHTAYSSTPPITTATDYNNVPLQHILYDNLDQHPHLQHHLSASHNPYPPRPTHVSPSKWAEALARNPDSATYTPISIVGADALSSRISIQQEKANVLKTYTQQLRDALQTLQQSRVATMQKIQYYQQEDVQLRQKMLMVMRKVEILRCMNLPLQPAERDLGVKLSNVAKQVTQMAEQLRSVQEMSSVYLHQKEKETKEMGDRVDLEQLSEQDKSNLSIVLEEKGIGLERLVSVVKKDIRDVEIMKKECQNKLY